MLAFAKLAHRRRDKRGTTNSIAATLFFCLFRKIAGATEGD